MFSDLQRYQKGWKFALCIWIGWGCTSLKTTDRLDQQLSQTLWGKGQSTKIQVAGPLRSALVKKGQRDAYRYDPDLGDDAPAWVFQDLTLDLGTHRIPTILRFFGGAQSSCDVPSMKLKTIEMSRQKIGQELDVILPCPGASQAMSAIQEMVLSQLYAALTPVSLKTKAVTVLLPEIDRQKEWRGFVKESPEHAAQRLSLRLQKLSRIDQVSPFDGPRDEAQRKDHVQAQSIAAHHHIQDQAIHKYDQLLQKSEPSLTEIQRLQKIQEEASRLFDEAGILAISQVAVSPDYQKRLSLEWEQIKAQALDVSQKRAARLAIASSVNLLLFNLFALHEDWDLSDWNTMRTSPSFQIFHQVALMQDKNGNLLPVPLKWESARIWSSDSLRTRYRQELQKLKLKSETWSPARQQGLRAGVQRFAKAQETMLRLINGAEGLNEEEKRQAEGAVVLFNAVAREVIH